MTAQLNRRCGGGARRVLTNRATLVGLAVAAALAAATAGCMADRKANPGPPADRWRDDGAQVSAGETHAANPADPLSHRASSPAADDEGPELSLPRPEAELTAELIIGAYRVREWDGDSFGASAVEIATAEGVLDTIPAGKLATDGLTDVNDNGIPDVVVYVQTGGNACCEGTVVYEFGSEPTRLLETPVQPYCSADLHGTFRDLDGDGVDEYLTCTSDIVVLECAYYWKMFMPPPKVVLRYEPGVGYVPAGPEFPEIYEEEIAELGGGMSEDGSYTCDVIQLAMDLLYSGRTEEGWQALERWLPPEEVEPARRALEEHIRRDPFYVAPGGEPRPVLVSASRRLR